MAILVKIVCGLNDVAIATVPDDVVLRWKNQETGAEWGVKWESCRDEDDAAAVDWKEAYTEMAKKVGERNEVIRQLKDENIRMNRKLQAYAEVGKL